MAKRTVRYTPEFKRQMVGLVRSGRTAGSLAKEFGPTTTSCDEYGVAYLVRFPAPADPLQVRSRAAENSAQAWSRSSPVPLAIIRLVIHRISQVPGKSIPYLCPALGSRPVRRPSPSRPNDAAPTLRTVRAPALRTSRDSITRLQYPLPTLQVMRYRTRMQGSLQAGD